MFNRSLFSSTTGEWETPQDVFDALSLEFGGFDLDPCATEQNAKCKRYFTLADNGLAQTWAGKVFVNPPYGREIGDWIWKCYISSMSTADLVVALLPSRTDTKWWHDWVMLASEIRFIRGRLKFGGATNSAPFPSAIAVWRRPLTP